MPHDDLYESWKGERARADVPDGFADRVMASVRAQEQQQRQALLLRGWLLVLVSSRLGRIGLWVVASLVCAFRMASVAALFIPR
jgi:hypothetical protein